MSEPLCATRRIRTALACFAAFAAIATPSLAAKAKAAASIAAGPDVTVYSLSDIGNYTSGGAINGQRAYSVGTVSCNIGSQPLNWCDNSGGCTNGQISLTWNQHPVIAQNLYRLKAGRFEQIGMSWLKHGFVSTNSFANDCRGANNETCVSPPLGGNQLGVGCTDPYGSSLNGSRPLGMRSEVNPTTGYFPFPETVMPTTTALDQRIIVEDSDVDPALNAGARYWVEGQYVADNDALSGNGLNNGSYREVAPTATVARNLSFLGGTIREKSAIEVWPVVDPTVALVNVDLGSGLVQRFRVARKVTNPSPGVWHWEIAVQNHNSDRAARSIAIDFPGAANITNVGFHDIEHHSGEPYDGTDWTVNVNAANGRVTWSTEDFESNPDANALRWATTFSFWFDVDTGATPFGQIGLFKPNPAQDEAPLYFSLPPTAAARGQKDSLPFRGRR